jgi:acetyl-CoA C-acetyltransferase
MREVYIAGIACTPMGRSELLEHEMMIPVLLEALDDAGFELQDLDGVIMSHPRMYTRQRYFANFLTDYLRVQPRSILMEVMGDGLTGALAVRQAIQEVAIGNAEVAVGMAVSMETRVSADEHSGWAMRSLGDVDYQAVFGPTASPWPLSMMALVANRYTYESEVHENALHEVSLKNRLHASMNPIAQFKTPITLEDILASPMITEPFHMLDCSPRSDGAAAVIVTSGERLRNRDKAVKVLGVGFGHHGLHELDERPRDMLDFEPITWAAEKAWSQAGVTGEDIDLVEIYSPTPILEVLASEALGFYKRGQGAQAAAEGRTRFDGEHPLVTSGGCMSRGNPPLAAPIYDVIEVAQQLRGEAGGRQVKNAEMGMSIAQMGMYNGALAFVLGR